MWDPSPTPFATEEAAMRRSPSALAVKALAPLTFALALLAAPPAAALTGGPDAYGYTFIDSAEFGGPVYSWVDISATGTPMGLADDGETQLVLPFTFFFYGVGYDTATLGANGALLFGPVTDLYFSNYCIPADNAGGTDALIAPLWDDLNPGFAGEVYVEEFGAFPARSLVIQWQDVPFFNSDTYVTFQMILYEATYEILFQYASLDGPDANVAFGAAASVGVQDSDTLGLEYTCNGTVPLSDGLAVLFDVACLDDDGDGVGYCDGDCNDNDVAVGPLSPEVADGFDNDCDGLVDEDFVFVGDLVISEIHLRPDGVPGPDGQWFEVTNVAPNDMDLIGWEIWTSDGQAVTIDASVLLASGERAVIAASDDPVANGGLPVVDWAHGGALELDEDGDELSLWLAGVEIDWVPIDLSFQGPDTGRALYADPDYLNAMDNDSPFGWCLTPADPLYDFGGFPGDYGTPGAENPAGLCCTDDDGDGVSTCAGDCDDADPDVFPGNPEIQDQADNDCDGLADEDFVTEGSVVISEFMDDPGLAFDAVGEWIELANNTPFTLNLRNWELSDNGTDYVVIDEDVILLPASVVVLAASDDPLFNGNLPQVDWVYAYSEFSLHSSDDDAIVLTMGPTEVDRVEYTNADPWPSLEGHSTYLDLDYLDAASNDDPYVWCSTPEDEVFDFGGGPGDYGTPGDTNPPNLCCIDEDGDGYSRCDGDCDETDPDINPGAIELCNGIDEDCDGALPADEQDVDGDAVMACEGDCDDTELTVFPGAPELCDGLDNDCDGTLPPFDADGDGDGSPICADCDDDDPLRYPEAHEACDGIDNDCDDEIPAEELDGDGDGYAPCEGDCDDTDPTLESADADGDGATTCQGDCDDDDLTLNLADADEDGVTSCDGDCDDLDPLLDPNDWDNDGFSTCDGDCNDGAPALNLNDVDGDGFSTCDDDCHDWDATMYPGAAEICGDGLDNDCDGNTDDADLDGDGYMDVDCGGEDCDDSDPDILPGAEEVCDGADNDCDGNTDDVDADGDGAFPEECGGEDCDDTDDQVGPEIEEVCDDGIDNDCDGVADPAELCDPGDDDDATGDDDDTTGDDDDDDDDDDCSCDVDGGPSGGSAVFLGILLGLIAVRRRRG